ncbi:VOC family protein [Amycolatopsis sp. NPDC049688]|uniref:VOC family protein n=1 Tax=Amycolatopsis sp. NPDC049688 TaxID=3154733 RepID=UPI003415438D
MITFAGMSLPVTSLDRSIPFYTALGFTLEIRTDRFALLRLATGTLGLLELGTVVEQEDERVRRLRTFVQVELLADDLDQLYAEFVERGIQVPNPPRDRGFERQLQLRDPDGFTVEFADHSPR